MNDSYLLDKTKIPTIFSGLELNYAIPKLLYIVVNLKEKKLYKTKHKKKILSAE